MLIKEPISQRFLTSYSFIRIDRQHFSHQSLKSSILAYNQFLFHNFTWKLSKFCKFRSMLALFGCLSATNWPLRSFQYSYIFSLLWLTIHFGNSPQAFCIIMTFSKSLCVGKNSSPVYNSISKHPSDQTSLAVSHLQQASTTSGALYCRVLIV